MTDLVSLLEQAEHVSFTQTRPRVTAVYEFLRDEILSAAADGYMETIIAVSDQWYHDPVNQKLVQTLLSNEGVAAEFEHGKWFLSWRA